MVEQPDVSGAGTARPRCRMITNKTRRRAVAAPAGNTVNFHQVGCKRVSPIKNFERSTLNFSTGLNLHIRAIQSLQQVHFLGEPVSMLGAWTPNPWVRLCRCRA